MTSPAHTRLLCHHALYTDTDVSRLAYLEASNSCRALMGGYVNSSKMVAAKLYETKRTRFGLGGHTGMARLFENYFKLNGITLRQISYDEKISDWLKGQIHGITVIKDNGSSKVSLIWAQNS